MPVNVRGQLLFRGYPMFLKYKDEPELTAQAKTDDGWFKTGSVKRGFANKLVALY